MTATTGARRRTPAAWRRRGYRQLTGAWMFTNLADSVLFLMVAVWVKELSDSDVAAALVFAAFGLAAVSAPFLGQLADRVSRKRLLVIANAAMVPVVLALLAVDSVDLLWLVYVVLFLYGCAGYLTAAAQSGVIRDLLPDDELAAGNGLLSTIDQAFRLGAPLVGTALYVLVGPVAVILVTAVAFLAAAVLLSRLDIVESGPAPRSGGYRREIVAGVAHLSRTSPLGRLTVTIAIAFAATGLLNVAVFPIMEQGLGVEPAMLGVFVAVQGGGAVVGGAISALIITRVGERAAVGLGLVVLALGTAALLTSSIPLVIAAMLFIGASVPVLIVAYVTLCQRLTPPGLQGRVGAASNLAFNLPQTIATLGGAALLGVVDYRWLIAMTAAVVLVSSIGAWVRGRAPQSEL
ncbi:MFS transporter [Agromyces atrinae]|uniref:MFS transporter n=1 Tax=Agromyces atrinae TaxID=592376 RepID=UPI001F582F5A|nr:MFS transporter [Agromyces atrinae]MCI2959413.1 MFS transporter [Agromyces atrinae]